MSGGPACNCAGRRMPIERRPWRVVFYRRHHSAFQGGRPTPSSFSLLACDRCGRTWRSDAAYVEEIRDAAGESAT